jgi:hypothetical protein
MKYFYPDDQPIMTARRISRTSFSRHLLGASFIVALMVWAVSARQATQSTMFVTIDGNDAAAGTVSSPWRTIQHCIDHALPGDSCLLGSGIFAETLRISTNGDKRNRIRISGRADGSTIIHGTVIIDGDYVDLEHLKIDMPDAAIAGLSMTGRFDIADSIMVSTQSNALGLNNAGITLSGAGHILKQSRVERTCFGIMLSGSSHTVIDNEVTALRLSERCGDVDYVRVFGSEHLLKGNFLHGIDRSETGSAHIDCFQSFDNNGPDRAVIDIVIDGNICSDASQGLMFTGTFNLKSRNVIVRNNIIRHVGAWCGLFVDVSLVRIFNNTCDTSDGLYGLWCRGKTSTGSCEFKNNIFYGRGPAYGVMDAARLINGNRDAPGEGNLIFSPGKTVTGYALDHLNEDPRFVDRTLADYHLLPSSPARDSGLSISDWDNPVDREGVKRPQGNGWDIGAYEFVESRPAPPANLTLFSN